LAAIYKSSPVFGLRPFRAARSDGWNVPKPDNETLDPAATSYYSETRNSKSRQYTNMNKSKRNVR
jgi:hypothetical protein